MQSWRYVRDVYMSRRELKSPGVFWGVGECAPTLAVPRMWAGNLVKSAGQSVRVDYRIYYRVWVTVDYVRERWDVGHTDGVGALGWAHSHDTSEIRIWRSLHSERKVRSWCQQRPSLKFRSLVFKSYIKHWFAVKDLCLSSSGQVLPHSVLKQGNGWPLVRKTDFIIYVISVKLLLHFFTIAEVKEMRQDVLAWLFDYYIFWFAIFNRTSTG